MVGRALRMEPEVFRGRIYCMHCDGCGVNWFPLKEATKQKKKVETFVTVGYDLWGQIGVCVYCIKHTFECDLRP